MGFKAALIQMRAVSGEVEGNRKSALRLVEKAAKAGARLAVLPELWPTGYHLSSLRFRELAETVRGETVSLFRRIAADWRMALVVPFAEKDGGKLYNSAAVIPPGKWSESAAKPSVGREKEIFTPGPRSYPVFATSLGKIGVLICYDAEFPEPAKAARLKGRISSPFRRYGA